MINITNVCVGLVNAQSDGLRAICSITIEGHVVLHGLRVYDGPNGLKVDLPARTVNATCSTCRGRSPIDAPYCNQCGERMNRGRSNDVGTEVELSVSVPIAQAVTPECHASIRKRVVDAYAVERKLAARPGYIPNFSEFVEPFKFGRAAGRVRS